jgi:hypothetical protein
MAPENKDVEKIDDEQEEEFVAVEEPEGKVDDDDLDDDGEGEGQQDERLADGQEEDDDDKKERRRGENKTRRQRQKDARVRTERELNFLRTRNADLEQRFSHFEQETDARIAGSEIATVDQSINKARSDMQLANQVIEQAVAANDGKNLAEALDHRDTIRDNLRDLEQAKEYLAQPAMRRQASPARDLDPRHVAHAQQFMVDNDWWDPAGRDQDSVTVLQIDRSLVQEGFNPTNKDYWDELRARTAEALPTRYDSRAGKHDDGDGGGSGNGQQRPTGQNRGPQFRTGGRERPLRKNEVYISPERKEAMIEAGVWEDPVLRNKYLKSYATYDKEAQAGGA